MTTIDEQNAHALEVWITEILSDWLQTELGACVPDTTAGFVRREKFRGVARAILENFDPKPLPDSIFEDAMEAGSIFTSKPERATNVVDISSAKKK